MGTGARVASRFFCYVPGFVPVGAIHELPHTLFELRITVSFAARGNHVGGTWLMAYSASAVIVRLGLMPGLAGMIEPSTTYSPG
jgi:hypothetical protein